MLTILAYFACAIMMRGRNCAGLFRDKEMRFSLSVIP
jgi:hypothetical protein